MERSDMPGNFSRSSRVADLMQHEVASIIANELKDPGIRGLVTLVEVELTRDLHHATLWISVLGTKAEKNSTMKSLERARGFIRTVLGRRLKIRKMPELRFRLDRSIDAREEIERLLSDV